MDSLNPFSPNETRLYFFLLSRWINQTEQKPFECSTHYLETHLLLPKMTITRCREKLKQRGMIQYVKGDRKVKNPFYFLCGVTNSVTKHVTNPKEKVSPVPPLKENNLENREKERITKVIPKKEENLAFCLPSYVPIMQVWLEYKKERGQAYKPRGLMACYNNLLKLSNNNPTIARLIVEQSIANNYQGLFELKNNGVNQKHYSEKRAANEEVFRQFVAEREQRASGMVVEVEKPF